MAIIEQDIMFIKIDNFGKFKGSFKYLVESLLVSSSGFQFMIPTSELPICKLKGLWQTFDRLCGSIESATSKIIPENVW